MKGFIAANEEQRVAIRMIREFIDTCDGLSWFTLQGKAGTGKTTLIQEAIAPYVNKKIVIIAALAHKAKQVLEKKVLQRFNSSNIHGQTIASLLGMTFDEETGKFYFAKDRSFLEPPVKSADIIIIDECSQVNEEGLRLIMEEKRPSACVIFLGDIGQLPPIREKFHPTPGADSPTFNTEYTYKLKTRIRQGEASPILPYADYFWNNSQSAEPVLSPAGPGERISEVSWAGSLVFSGSTKAFAAVMPVFKESVRTGNPDLCRVVVYRNHSRHTVNRLIRQGIFGAFSADQFVPGELIMFYDNFGVGTERISNSTEAQVRTVERKLTDDSWNIFELGVAIDGRPHQLQVIASEDLARFKSHLQALADHAKTLSGKQRSEAWQAFYGQKERFAPVEYSYAITCHKCQGSTYDVCLIAEADIVSVGQTSYKTKSQAIYTALTRASKLAIVMDAYTDHSDLLDKAMACYYEPTQPTLFT